MTEKRAYHTIPPATMLNPTPVVLVSCAEKDHPEIRNMVTVAWAGTVNSEPPMVSISLKKERYSHGLILRSGEFVINLVDAAMCRAVDYCGVRSGRDVDKAKETGLREVFLLPYHKMASAKYARMGLPYTLLGLENPTAAHMEELRARFAREGFETHIGG